MLDDPPVEAEEDLVSLKFKHSAQYKVHKPPGHFREEEEQPLHVTTDKEGRRIGFQDLLHHLFCKQIRGSGL